MWHDVEIGLCSVVTFDHSLHHANCAEEVVELLYIHIHIILTHYVVVACPCLSGSSSERSASLGATRRGVTCPRHKASQSIVSQTSLQVGYHMQAYQDMARNERLQVDKGHAQAAWRCKEDV